MTTPNKTQQHWKKHVDAAKAAGQTFADYAREHTLNVQTLYSHSRKVNKSDKVKTKPAFVRVQRSATTAVGSVHIELKNGVRVHVSAPIDLASLLAQAAQLP